jgi:hypothetical protein
MELTAAVCAGGLHAIIGHFHNDGPVELELEPAVGLDVVGRAGRSPEHAIPPGFAKHIFPPGRHGHGDYIARHQGPRTAQPPGQPAGQ